MRSERQLARSSFDDDQVAELTRDIRDLEADLARLRPVPEPSDPVQEMHLRILARCRLLELDEYRITGFIGAGQCGTVYRAVSHTVRDQAVALKILFFPKSDEELSRFQNEARILHQLRHDAIVRGLTIARGDPSLPISWYAMELVAPATTLDQLRTKVSTDRVLNIVADACEALGYAHARGVVHRDLHPENILITSDGRTKVLDFGAARSQQSNLTFRPVGSLRTCSPEKLERPDCVGGGSDIFSIGCILYYITKGTWPFGGKDFGEKVDRLRACESPPLAGLDLNLAECIRVALSKDPEARQPAERLAVELREIASRLGRTA